MDDQQIMCFLVLSKELSFSKTAEVLFTTQPAVSRTIRILEDEWKIKLFERNSKQVKLTKAGSIMANGLEALMEQFQTIHKRAVKTNDGYTGEVSIGVLQEFMLDTFPYALNTFEANHPDIRISIITEPQEELHRKLQSGAIDFVLGGRENLGALDCPYVTVGRRNIGMAVPSNHPLAESGSPLSLADFKEDTFATLPESAAPAYKNLIMRCARAGFIPNTCFAPDMSTLLLWVELGRCISIQYESAFILGNSHIRFLEMEDVVAENAVISWAEDFGEPNPCKQEFIDFISNYKWPL